MNMRRSLLAQHRSLLAVAPACFLAACVATSSPQVSSGLPTPGLESASCESLTGKALANAPVAGLVLTSAQWHPAGMTVRSRGGMSAPLPAHCEIVGAYGGYIGLAGGAYRTGFRMRLPQDWNGRFLFSGGGGSNGVINDATGFNGPGNPLALNRGYAVIAQDSGHDNDTNNDPAMGGELVFGHDPVARTNYGHASLKSSYDVGLHLITTAYGRAPATKLFWGCSKGGQEGMAFAQRYPEAFDGIVAMAPGFALPRAAVAQAWSVQQFATILRARGITPTVNGLSSAISADQFSIVTQTVTQVCDADDGVADGIIGAIGRCTTDRVLPALRQRQCRTSGEGNCLDAAQIDGLVQVMRGPRDSSGNPLYAEFPWDTGLSQQGWRAWRVGLDGQPPRDIPLGGGSLAAVMTSPATALSTDPAQLLAWQLAFDFDRDAARIYAVAAPFTTSPWADIGMRSTDLAAFREHGGKLIVPHGMSDPVFSAYDTIDWWNSVNRIENGRAADFVRVFPVPGMNHCGGGAATDQFDSLAALENWVINRNAPGAIAASAGPDTPWPGRERPICAYPTIATPAPGGRWACTRQAD